MNDQGFTTSFSVARRQKKFSMPSTTFAAGGQEKLTVAPTNSAPSSHTVTKTFTALNKKSRNSVRARESFGAC